MAKIAVSWIITLVAGLMCAVPASSEPSVLRRHSLAIDDVLDTVAIERAVYSPDGAWVAAVVQRPARSGEVYGRTAYEIDPSRNDIWLISTRTGERRNLTEGQSSASGFWCPAWSPDGKRLAMLSTKPEGAEPRGGDNVRLYLWDIATEEMTRLSQQALITQTRMGSPLHALDMRSTGVAGGSTQVCLEDDENAPFIWIDNNNLLAVTLPEGEVSALLDQYNRPFDQAAATQRALKRGEVPTVSAMGAGDERMIDQRGSKAAVLQRLRVDTGEARKLAYLPAYPFNGSLTLSLAPDRRHLAILAPIGAIPPTDTGYFPYNATEWLAEKRLGILDMLSESAVHWLTLPEATRYPLDIIDWSPNARAFAFRGRANFSDKDARLFVVDVHARRTRIVAQELLVGTAHIARFPHERPAHWLRGGALLVLGKRASPDRMDWWLIDKGTAPRNLSADLKKPPSDFQPLGSDALGTLSDRQIIRFSLSRKKFTTYATSIESGEASIQRPLASYGRGESMLIGSLDAAGQHMQILNLTTGQLSRSLTIPARATLLDARADRMLWRDPERSGLTLLDADLSSGGQQCLLERNSHLGNVAWSDQILIDYKSIDGRSLKANVILPFGYVKGHAYPTIMWVYGGYVVRGKDDYFSDPYMAGLYNLHLYAARGYAVVIPSMPLARNAEKQDVYGALPNGVLPALDRLVALGITDPKRVGVMGQSFGGYSVYALIAQTNRFKAAVALAGITDMAGTYGQLDPLARGYPGIEHEMSANAVIAEHVFGLGVPPYEDPALYQRNSPIAYVKDVDTPLLAIHGEFDMRGSPAQAEEFFYSLYRQGKTAKLLRYWGESHGLSQSPANVRNIFDESLGWFDRYLKYKYNDNKHTAR
jgi:acetyl esterase/lipase